MSATELSEEEVFDNDKDPLEALREIRRAEGSGEEANIEDDTGTNAADIMDDKATEPGAVTESTDDSSEDPTEDPTKEEESEDDAEPEPKPESDPGTEEESSEEETSEEDSEESTDASIEKILSESHTFKAGGKEFTFTGQEMLDSFETVLGQSVDYTQKTQAIAPYRKMISALESEGITHDQLNMALDALKGNKGAIQELMKMNEIETFDLADQDESEKGYEPKQYGKNDYQLELDEVTDAISGDEEYPVTVDIIGRQWDQHSRQVFADNPTMIRGLHNDVKSGLFDKVAPVAMKMKVLDGSSKSDIEYYVLAGEQVSKTESTAGGKKSVDELNRKTQDAESKFDQQSSEAKKKRAAGSTKARADRKGVVDYLEDNDEDFDAWYKDLQARN